MEPHSGLNSLDYIVIGIVLLSGLLALLRGFLREIFSLIAWSAAYVAASKCYPLVLPTVHHYIKNDKAAEWASMAVMFVVVLILLSIVGSLICGMVRGKALTTIDRSLGFLYGLARGILVVGLVYLGARMILWPDMDAPKIEQQETKDHTNPPDMLMDAKTRPLLADLADKLKDLVPKEMIDEKLKASDKAALSQHEDQMKQQLLDTLSTPEPAGEHGTATVKSTTQGGAP